MKTRLIHGECIAAMKNIASHSVDLILCDLPYGTTKCAWDVIIPFDELWAQYERIIKKNGAIVLTCSQPFTSLLLASNPKLFRYELIWEKSRATGFLDANRRPLKKHENILVFSKVNCKYNPQFTEGKPYSKTVGKRKTELYDSYNTDKTISVNDGFRYPTSILKFKSEAKTIHPTQKPVALMEYLIKTFSDEEDIVLDNCMGSGTTGVACINTNRNFIGIEKDRTFFEIAENRILT